MTITQPIQLSRENLEKWGENFVKKVERTTTRTELDRLILAVERREFKQSYMAKWTKVVFDDAKGEVRKDDWDISSFEKQILDANKDFRRNINRAELNEENGEWKTASMKSNGLKIISAGGEAVVLEETIKGMEVAVRVQCFDPFLFTRGIEEYEFEWHLSGGEFLIPRNLKKLFYNFLKISF